MEIKQYVVTHREYRHDGTFDRSFSMPVLGLANAVDDANLVLDCYTANEVVMAVTPCNIVVRGPKGRFMKWRNK